MNLGDSLELDATLYDPTRPITPVELQVLDAEDLAVRTRADIARGAEPLASAGDALIYLLWSGLLVVDASAPDDHSKQRYLPLTGAPDHDTRVSLGDGRALISGHDSGRLRMLDLP